MRTPVCVEMNERVEWQMVNLRPATMCTDAIQSFVSQEIPIVLITDGDGAVGTGYSYTTGRGGQSVVALIERTLAPMLLGREAEGFEAIWRAMLMRTHATSVGAITALAIAAIETALWDLRCRKVGLPLYRLAGGAHASLPFYRTQGGWLHLEAEALTAGALAKGFAGAKVKVGRPICKDVARLSAMRAAVGLDFEIFTDANQALTVDKAICGAAAYAPIGIGWLEAKLPANDVEGHVRLARLTAIPIAMGESLYSLSHLCDCLQRGTCSIVQVDVARIGEITPWLKVAHLAKAYNEPVGPLFLMEAHVSLAAAVSNAHWVEYIPQIEAITSDAMGIEDGRAVPNDAPGLDIDWDWDAIAAVSTDTGRVALARKAA